VIGDDTITYEETSGTDPETLAEPVDLLMIENTTDIARQISFFFWL